MSKLLLVVEESFQVTGRGVGVTPDVPLDTAREIRSVARVRAQLKRPNGEEEVIEMTCEHANCVSGTRWLCFLIDAVKERVPPGTEIWMLDEMAGD